MLEAARPDLESGRLTPYEVATRILGNLDAGAEDPAD
jgi:hypothetical protein